MSGHSKWSTIKRKKAKLDAQKGKVFTRLIKEISVAARDGGGDIAGNSKLRLLVDKAKASNMPHDNITRAIKKGTGELEGGAAYESIKYEAYGPEGMALIIEALTDNKNRTASDLRSVLAKYNGKLAETGSVGWMFDHKGCVVIKKDSFSEDDVLEKMLAYNIDDVSVGENEYTIQCSVSDLESVKSGAEKVSFKVEDAEVEWVAKNSVSLSSQDVEDKAYRLLDALEELDDVQNVYANLK